MKLVCDASLGKLARYLRLLGLDAVYMKEGERTEACKDEKENLLFLTRRRSPVHLNKTVHITSDEVMDQLSEIRDLIRPLLDREKALKRCLECNGELLPAEKDEIEHLVPEFVFHHCNRFMVCPTCRKVYWEGSHVENMQRLVKEVIG